MKYDVIDEVKLFPTVANFNVIKSDIALQKQVHQKRGYILFLGEYKIHFESGKISVFFTSV